MDVIGYMADLYFDSVSGGFAVVQPDSQLSINAVEGFPVEDFSAEVNLLLLHEFQSIQIIC